MSIQDDTSIYAEYFKITQEYQTKYGKRTVLLMQVGAFFEVYGLTNQSDPIDLFSQVCSLNVSEKKATWRGSQVLMAGFRDYTLDKYLQKLTDSGFTAVVYVQERVGKQINRVLHSIHSAGTFLSYETDQSPQLTNHTMCIWIETHVSIRTKIPFLVFGVAVVNIFTGKASIFEMTVNQPADKIHATTLDELERCVSTFSPCEVILISGLDQDARRKVFQYAGITTPNIHVVHLDDEKAARCTQARYIKHMLGEFYGTDAYDTCSEFSTYVVATQALGYLLHFVQEHNPSLVRQIALPEFNNSSNRVVLANHTLKQLNIIPTKEDVDVGMYASVSTFLNKCGTAMGKRLFRDHLVKPTFDQEWLSAEYDRIGGFLETAESWSMVESFRPLFRQMYDVEKLTRQLVADRLYPSSLYHLYKTIGILGQIHVCLYELPGLVDYLGESPSPSSSISASSIYDVVDNECKQILEFLETRLDMEVCRTTTSISSFEKPIIRSGVSPLLDQALAIYETTTRQFQDIRDLFNDIMRKSEGGVATTEYIRVHETEKSGLSLQITKKRATTLKSILTKMEPHPTLGVLSKVVVFHSATTSNDEIDFPVLRQICRSMLESKESIQWLMSAAYSKILTDFRVHTPILDHLAKYVAKIDVLCCKAYLAKTYNYCRPVIDQTASKAFVDARDLRHCLIEHIQEQEVYVANDIDLGNGVKDGMLIYGTNAVGKTSLIRALGVAVIMAQAGLYVPCSQFYYKPYTAIFSRILGNDNLFKGLSTFAVEMSELRVILNTADQDSLILGDELCSGTETESALSIFVAGLGELHRIHASFVFATHFHEIVKYDEIKALDRLHLAHMAVHYDAELDALVYDRVLRDGPGNRMYGLEVCKSLHLPADFMDTAYAIRSKYFGEAKGGLDHSVTIYSAKKVRGFCEMCKTALGEEIHHLSPQSSANEDGFIGSVHKNHPANLMSICQKCHDKTHETKTKLTRKKTTKGYIVS